MLPARTINNIKWIWRRLREEIQTFGAAARFILQPAVDLSTRQRINLVRRFREISRQMTCAHTEAEMLAVATTIFSLPRDTKACVVEAGCWRGGSTTKLSICAAMSGRTLYVFDSFRGIPANSEIQTVIKKEREVVFSDGQYSGSLEEVQANIARHGAIEACRFMPGWFNETMPGWSEPVGAAYFDVDLVTSTRDCLKHLYPLVVPGGAIYSQDAHLSGVSALLADGGFWRDEVGVRPPKMRRLAGPKLMRIAGGAGRAA